MGTSESSHHWFKISGIRINAVQIPGAIAVMEEAILSKKSGRYIVAANVHVITEAAQNSDLKEAVNSSALTVPDGMPLVWAARQRGFHLEERVYGPDLMMTFLERTQDKKYRHFFYGSDDHSMQGLIRNLLTKFPALNICGYHCPPFRPLDKKEDEMIIRLINDAAPDILWVGLGCPKQEIWMYEHKDSLVVPLMAGVGQAFDLFAGTKRRAPRWMQKSGLEWLFRLSQEPRRLWSRYLWSNTYFIYRAIKEALFIKSG